MTILIVAKNGTCRVVPDFPVEGHNMFMCSLVKFVHIMCVCFLLN